MPKLYTSEADLIVSDLLEDTLLRRAELARELIELYSAIGTGEKNGEEQRRCEEEMEGIVRRKDKLLDLSVEGRISDQEFSTRNERFNQELEILRTKIQELEDERARRQRTVRSPEYLRQAISTELDFPQGFSGGIVESLIERMEVHGTEERGQVKIRVYPRGRSEPMEYRVIRQRGKPSVCSRAYI